MRCACILSAHETARRVGAMAGPGKSRCIKGGGCDEWDNTMADVKIKGMGTHPEIIESALNPEDSPVNMHVYAGGWSTGWLS